MKQTLLTFLFLLNLIGVKASIYFTPFNILDSSHAEFNSVDSATIDSLGRFYGMPVTSEQILQGPDQIIVLNTSKHSFEKMIFGWSDIGKAFQDAYDFITFKKNFGYFEVSGQMGEGPYALFDRTSGAPSLQDQLNAIQQWILNDSKAKQLYVDIWYQASSEQTGTDGCTGRGTCAAAKTAKCAAFIYIIGLKVSGPIDEEIVTRMGSSLDGYIGQAERDVYYEKTMMILHSLKNPYWAGSIVDNSVVDFLTGGLSTVFRIFQNLSEWDDMHFRTKEALMFLQAFDMLKWSHKTVPGLETPSKVRINKAAEKLRDNIVIPMHKRVKWGHYYANNNYTLMPAAVLGMASVVLHDYGDWALFFNGHPKEWAHAANYNIHNTMWAAWGGSPMSKPGGLYGYSEGTHYFQFAFENLLPYFKTYSNFVPTGYGKSYASGVISPFYHYVKNYSDDQDYRNLYEWYNKILQPDGNHPTIDDTYIDESFSSALALTKIAGSGQKGYNWKEGTSTSNQGLVGFTGLDLRADYLAALSPSYTETAAKNRAESERGYVQLPSGSTVIRSIDASSNDRHYVHLLAEPEEAISTKLYWLPGTTHEHADAGAIAIGAQELPGNFELLVIDPPMRNADDRDFVDEGFHHASVSVNHPIGLGISDDGPDYDTEGYILSPIEESFDKKIVKTTIGFNFYESRIKRELIVHRDPGKASYYYQINDIVQNLNQATAETYTLNIQGNGLSGESTFYTKDDGKTGKWIHPCTNGRKWGVLGTVTASNTDVEFNTYDAYQHGNSSVDRITNHRIEDNRTYGYHNTLRSEISSTSGLKFLTIIRPFKCSDTSLIHDIIARITNSYTTQLMTGLGQGDINRLHFNRSDTGGSYTDTINNPFNNGANTASLETDAQNGFFTVSDDSLIKQGGCITYTKFRSINVSKCKLFAYHDTTYIQSTVAVDCYYKIDGKFKYTGSCKTGSSSATVSFFLPDLRAGFEMKALGVSSYSYDTNTFIMSATFPANSNSVFVFELLDPCKLSCYYPDSLSNITGSFTQNDGIRQYLGHPLKILADTGKLNIYGGSQMSICSKNYLCNRDSLLLLKSEETKGVDLSHCDMDLMSGALTLGEGQRSAIIVNDEAALVLDSGSFTSIGPNSGIYIKSGGSLVIRSGAVVEIGGSAYKGYGELIAYSGSYICIEDSSDIHFYKDIEDTTDKNIFFAQVLNPNINGGSPVKPTGKGVGFIKTKLVHDTIIDPSPGCTELCELHTIIPPYGIYNRDWGYSPFVLPKATYQIYNDTVCPGDTLRINLNRILNETGYEIKVCRVDSPTGLVIECLITANDSGTYIDQRNQLAYDNGNQCIEIRRAPGTFNYLLKDTGWYKVYVAAYNDCGYSHDTTGFIYVPPSPHVVFSIPDSSCPGYGTVVADGSLTNSYLNKTRYHWSVVLVTPDSAAREIGNPIIYGADWEFDSTVVQNNFDFPGFKWIGGFKYAVGLTVEGWCTTVSKWDTITFPLMVMTNVHYATLYDNPVGPHALQLQGYVSGADTWSWSPTDYLNYPDSLNPVATTPDSIQYILTGTLGACSTSDTVTIRHNIKAYAGSDRSVCVTRRPMLGTDYNAANFIGLMYILGGRDFWDIYSPIRNDNLSNSIPVLKYFTQYLIETSATESYPAIVEDYWFNLPDLRKILIDDIDLEQYYNMFQSSNGDSTALNLLNAYVDSTVLKNIIFVDFGLKNLGSGEYSQLNSYFTDYMGWYTNNAYTNNFIDILWEKDVDTGWVEVTDSRGYYNIVPHTPEHSVYRMTLIDEVNSLVEFDVVTILVDTAFTPRFEVSYQTDSTVYFTNMTAPNPFNLYEWNFGDGSTHSANFHTVHTFPAFDSIYVVCLSLTNACGTYTYCDTIHIDSSGIADNGFSKKDPAHYDQDKTDTSNIVIADKGHWIDKPNVKVMKNEVLLDNIPNPFNESTTLSYFIGKEYKSAELRVTDVLGRVIKVYSLPSMNGFVVFDGSLHKRGLYYSSLIVDGMVVKSKTMVIER